MYIHLFLVCFLRRLIVSTVIKRIFCKYFFRAYQFAKMSPVFIVVRNITLLVIKNQLYTLVESKMKIVLLIHFFSINICGFSVKIFSIYLIEFELSRKCKKGLYLMLLFSICFQWISGLFYGPQKAKRWRYCRSKLCHNIFRTTLWLNLRKVHNWWVAEKSSRQCVLIPKLSL